MVDPIVTKGAKILKTPLKEVPKDMFGSKELQAMAARMSATLRTTEHGVAIAANQIGLPYRLFVVRGFLMEGMVRSDEGSVDVPDVAFVNPKIVKMSRKKELMEEACLSVPGYHGIIKRAPKATVKAFDTNGKKFERGGSGVLAEAFQHECDHLDGILYTDKAVEVYETPKEEDEPVHTTPHEKK